MQHSTRNEVQLPTRKRMPNKTRLTITIFLVVMLAVIGVQGTYLGYTVGILTNLERRFGISSRKSGTLLSIYDIGHTVAVILVGFMANGRNLPRITAIGVVLSAASMFFLALPAAIFGTVSIDQDSLTQNRQEYILANRCDPYRRSLTADEYCERQRKEEIAAFHILGAGQFLAGVAAAPFNTIAYVYIDDNLENKALSPFFLGLLSGMYAFGPAFGFGLSAGLTRVYSSITGAPPNLDINSEEWVGAWWLGFLICGVLYLFCSVPLFFFPKSLIHSDEDLNSAEMHQLRHEQLHLHTHHDHELVANGEATQKPSFLDQLKDAVEDLPYMAWDLLKNPVYTSMVIGWMFGSYLVGGFSTYLPKYIETQYGRSASAADMYAGIISIGSIAVSTALGGYILTKFNLSPRNAILCLIGSWLVILASYFLGMTVGCDEPAVKELIMHVLTSRYEFRDVSECNFDCHCGSVYHFNAVHHNTTNYFSPCHAGCREFNMQLEKWDVCSCANDGPVENGLYLEECNQIFAYIALMFVGLFFGNLFFMTTMMVILRAVYDCEKVMALSFASCITNVLGFIPAPILFGWIIDTACILWHSRCPNDRGNCVVYDNKFLRQTFHFSNAIIQLFAVISILFCYFFIRKRVLPEEERTDEDIADETRPEPIQTAL